MTTPERRAGPRAAAAATAPPSGVLVDISVPSVAGSVRAVRRHVGSVCDRLGLSARRSDALLAAVAEATANAIEHGNGGDPGRAVRVSVRGDGVSLWVRVVDDGRGSRRASAPAEVPDVEAKVRGEQRPRGWGRFLMAALVDEVREHHDGEEHVVDLVVSLDDGRP